MSALDDLDKYVTQEGPLNGVIGFSQRAALAAMFIIRQYSSPRGESDAFLIFEVFVALLCCMKKRL